MRDCQPIRFEQRSRASEKVGGRTQKSTDILVSPPPLDIPKHSRIGLDAKSKHVIALPPLGINPLGSGGSLSHLLIQSDAY